MDKPKYYLHNEERLNDHFVFISYSHRDADAVYDVLRQLFDLGINYWYDDGLNVGDFWNEKVVEILNKPDCLGAIVFLSENSVNSDPVNQEVEIMLKLKEERGFTIAPIVIGYKTARDLVNGLAKKSDEFLGKLLGDKFHIRRIVSDDINRTIEECIPHLERLADSIDVREKHTVVVGNTDIDKLPHIKDGGKKLYRLGSYPFYRNGEKAQVYWELLSREKDTVYMISQYCIDFTEKSDIQAALKGLKASLGDYAACVEDIVIPSDSFIEENRDKISASYITDYAESKRSQLLRSIWVRSSENDGYVLYNTLGAKISENINQEIITAGIRPVIIINNTKIHNSKETVK